MVFITEGFFEVAIERWPEWDLIPRPLNSHIHKHIYTYKLVTSPAQVAILERCILVFCNNTNQFIPKQSSRGVL